MQGGQQQHMGLGWPLLMAACLVQHHGGPIVGSLLLLQLVPTQCIQQDLNPGPPGVLKWV